MPHVSSTRSAALAIELETGRVVFTKNRSRALAPASTQKLPVSYALLTRLGPGHRIRTAVVGTGARDGAAWRGHLVLKGFGDPTFSTAGLHGLAGRLRRLGIRRVTGDVVGDESYFDARRTALGWRPSFYLHESAPISALSVNGGRFHGVISRAPALTAARLFRDALRVAGISVSGGVRTGRAPADAEELAARASPPLVRLLRLVNSESDNFAAEVLLKHLGAVEGGRGTTAAGTAVVRETLAEASVPLAGVRIADGSGLSRLDRLTVDALAGLLAAVWSDPVLRAAFRDTLAVAGRRGTLERRLRGPAVAGRVHAKTGTTRIASALSGYVGERYAFAVLQNGSPVSSFWARLAQDRFVTVLARS